VEARTPPPRQGRRQLADTPDVLVE